MTGTRSRQSSEARLRADLATIVAPEPRTNLPLLIWRWRYEFALIAVTTGAVTALVLGLGAEWGLITASALAGLCSPPWPRPVAARAWCVITAHRLRCGFVRARIQTRRGAAPSS